MNSIDKITFYGDSRYLPKYMKVIYFPRYKIVCDFTECGLYIADGFAKHEKPKIVKLEDLLKQFPKNNLVIAYNNGIYRLFEEKNIKTVGDLLSYMENL